MTRPGVREEDAVPRSRRCAGILACPVCREPLDDEGRTLRCPRRHAFDRAREGYVHLLPAGHGRTRLKGDAPEMVRARREFLERGHFEPLAGALAEAVARHRASQGDGGRIFTVVDAGCGVGYYVGRVAAALGEGDACIVGVDVSKDAVRIAARAHRDVTFVVNDLKHAITVVDGAADVVLNVFAPRNPAEFRRVLRPDGLVVVAIPTDRHLRELRESLPLLTIEAEKRERTMERLAPAFTLDGERTIAYRRTLSADDVVALLRMTPNFWHLDETALDAAAALGGIEVGFDVRILHFRPTGS